MTLSRFRSAPGVRWTRRASSRVSSLSWATDEFPRNGGEYAASAYEPNAKAADV